MKAAIGRILLAALLAAAGPAAAQEEVAKKKPARTLRLLPLGDAPPFLQEIRDGVRYELEPPAGSIPPRQVSAGAGESAANVRLNLGRISDTIPLPEGAVAFPLHAGEGEAPWLRLELPEQGDLLALFWRPRGAAWTEPRVKLLPDSPEAFPAGTVRLVNLTRAAVAAVVGKQSVALAAGDARSVKLPAGEDVPLQLAVRQPTGEPRTFFSSAVLLNPGERGHVIVYLADGEKPRQPVKVFTLNEPVAAP